MKAKKVLLCLLLALSLCLCLALASCKDDEGGEPTPPPTTTDEGPKGSIYDTGATGGGAGIPEENEDVSPDETGRYE